MVTITGVNFSTRPGVTTFVVESTVAENVPTVTLNLRELQQQSYVYSHYACVAGRRNRTP